MPLTVTTPPNNTDLTTKARFKTVMGISGSTEDTFIDMLIQQATAFIVGYCGRDFALQTVTETIRTRGGKYLSFSRFPVRTLTSISYQGTAVDSSLYLLDKPEIPLVLNIDDYWNDTGWKYDYSAVYQYGYVLTSFSSGTVDREAYDLDNACMQLVKAAYLTRSSHPGVKREEMPDVRSISFAGGEFADTGINQYFSPAVAQILSPYKKYTL